MAEQEVKKPNVRIKRIVEWIHPYFDNRHTMPYGTLEVTDGTETKMCRTKGDTIEGYAKYGCQCITFNRKRYEVKMTSDGKGLYLEPMF